MIRIANRHMIDVPVAAAFAYAADPENNPRWWPSVLEATLLTPGPVGPGSRFREVGQGPMGKITSVFEVEAYEPAREARFRVVEGPLAAEVIETFTAVGDSGTELTVTVVVQTPGLLRLAQPLLRRMLDKSWKAGLLKVKRQLESAPDTN